MRLGVLGGTFDPVHVGHVDVARAAQRALALDQVWLVPACVPPHRPDGPHASAYHRFAMTAIAVLEEPGLVAADIELRASGPSFTAATLDRLRRLGHDPWQLFFITGADAFAEIATWRDYPSLLDRANFVVVSRPHMRVSAMRSRLTALSSRMIDIGASDRWSGEPQCCTIFLLDAPTTDVSSTEIRRRVVAGESLGGLVPAGVERHISHHHLYAPLTPAADDLHD